MSKIRIYGDTSGYVDLTVPAVSDNSSLSIGELATQSYADNAATSASGLILISTQNFSSISSLSFDNVFSSTYDTYLAKAVCTTSGTGGYGYHLRFRMRSSSVDDSGTNYPYRYITSSVGGTSLFAGAITAWTHGVMSSTGDTPYSEDSVMEIHGPFLSRKTYMITTHMGGYFTFGNIIHSQALPYDGISFFTEAGTMTGSISIYGYKK